MFKILYLLFKYDFLRIFFNIQVFRESLTCEIASFLVIFFKISFKRTNLRLMHTSILINLILTSQYRPGCFPLLIRSNTLLAQILIHRMCRPPATPIFIKKIINQLCLFFSFWMLSCRISKRCFNINIRSYFLIYVTCAYYRSIRAFSFLFMAWSIVLETLSASFLAWLPSRRRESRRTGLFSSESTGGCFVFFLSWFSGWTV